MQRTVPSDTQAHRSLESLEGSLQIGTALVVLHDGTLRIGRNSSGIALTQDETRRLVEWLVQLSHQEERTEAE